MKSCMCVCYCFCGQALQVRYDDCMCVCVYMCTDTATCKMNGNHETYVNFFEIVTTYGNVRRKFAIPICFARPSK